MAAVREPQNPHDPNAIAIYDPDQKLKLGYVPRQLAATLKGNVIKSLTRGNDALSANIIWSEQTEAV